MVENGYVTREEGDKAKAEPLGVKPRRTGTYLFAGEYFTEEVRREIIARYGENALYEGGLSVRTTLDPKTAADRPQGAAERPDQVRHAARLSRPGRQDRHGVRRLGRAARRGQGLDDVPEWRLAVVLESSDAGLTIGLQPKREVSGQGRRRSARPARSPART